MKIKSIKINNYKSLKEEKNKVYLEDSVTSIIGKNESGKSNVLEAIGDLHYYNKMNNKYFKSTNRSSNKRISAEIILQFNEKEYHQYTKIEYMGEETYLNIYPDVTTLSGALSELIFKDKKLKKCVDTILELSSSPGVWLIGNDNNKKIRKENLLQNIEKYNETVILNPITELKFIKSIINNSNSEREILIKEIDSFFSLISNYMSLLPNIYYRKEEQSLKSYYATKEIIEIFKKEDDILIRLLDISNITQEELLTAFNLNDRATAVSTRSQINRKIKRKVQERFNEFYSQEKIELDLSFYDTGMDFTVTSNEGEKLLLSERSNGLRWYLSLFVDIIADNYSENNTLFVLDEPGVHLHINAQKELLKLFEDLTKGNNQVIYSTHLPTMIDINNMVNIRAIEKVDGVTVIFNSFYDSAIPGSSHRETLSPLLKALGMNLSDNIGFNYDKINIITEGITDYLYIKAMQSCFSISNDDYYFVPSNGAPGIINIAMILQGWGLRYKILLDYDQAGYEEYKKINSNLGIFDISNEVKFVNGEIPINIMEVKENPFEIEDLIAESDFMKLESYNNLSKTLVAKEFYDKVSNGDISLENETIENFKKLFQRLNIIK